MEKQNEAHSHNEVLHSNKHELLTHATREQSKKHEVEDEHTQKCTS